MIQKEELNMKLVLKFMLDGTEPDGYIHIGMATGFNPNVVADAECTEILAEDLIDYLPLPKMGEVLKWVRSKMRHGCKLIIGGTDIYELSKAFSSFHISLTDFNKLVYSEGKSTMLTLPALVELIEQLELKVITKRVNNFKMVVVAERV